MTPTTTKTLGPLHLEDLDPRRFEDLVRQLVYDFKAWRMLEATGRAGSDDGFDARGYEMVDPQAAPEADEDDDDAESDDGTSGDRLWLVQCKREKAIGPTKLVSYLDDIPVAERSKLYGIVLAAACDFSKKARDDFRAKVREFGIGEAHLWGKAEIEDQLFQPKNDHLLFAYFGISLQARRRSLKTAVRARLAMKRKATKNLSSFLPVLLRDAGDERYPWQDPDESLPRERRRRWRVVRIAGCHHDGVRIVHRRYFAFVGDDGESWDFVEWFNDVEFSPHEDPWSDQAEADRTLRHRLWRHWIELPDQNRATYEIHLVIPYENILDIDMEGDDYFRGPHIYAAALNGHSELRDYSYTELKTSGTFGRHCAAEDAKRVKKLARSEDELPAEDTPGSSGFVP